MDIRTIVARKELTSEWKQRGVNDGLEFASLTNTISQETFGMHTENHKRVKGLSRSHSLRDHMTDLGLMAMRDGGLSLMGGEGAIIEADATYWGAKEKNKHVGKRNPKDIRRGGKEDCPYVDRTRRRSRTLPSHSQRERPDAPPDPDAKCRPEIRQLCSSLTLSR